MTESSETGLRSRLLLTGDELLRGFIQDANTGFVADRLRTLGIGLDEIRIIGDDIDEIERALGEAINDDGVDLAIVCGGLGPTHDDRTSEAVAKTLAIPLELADDALEVVEARVRAFGRMRTPEEVATFAPGNRKQATFPVGATWFDPLGTAPSYAVRSEHGAVVVVLPGPPAELRHAWRHVEESAELASMLDRVVDRHERLVRLWGVPESRASQALAATGHVDRDDVRVTICARDGELEISIRGSASSDVDELAAAMQTTFADEVFAVDDHRTVVEMIAQALTDRRMVMGTCESCTGGMIAARLTSTAGSSAWFAGGLVTYANEVKVAAAGVDAGLIERAGAVSEEVAHAMAAGATEALSVDVAVAVTGIAGPGGGSDDKPVGTVHLAVHHPGGRTHRKVRIPGDRDTVRRRTTSIALHMLRECLGA